MGNGLDATLENGASCVRGLGVELDGVDDYVSLGAVELGGALTFALSARTDGLTDYMRLFDFGDSTGANGM
jgi:hypothetical protein